MYTLGVITAFALAFPVAFLAILIFWKFSALVLLFGLGAWCAGRLSVKLRYANPP